MVTAIPAAAVSSPAIARRLVRQAWDRWPLDAFFPMQYRSFYEEPMSWITNATREGVSALAPGTPLHAGLYLPSLTPVQLGTAARLARGGLSDRELRRFHVLVL